MAQEGRHLSIKVLELYGKMDWGPIGFFPFFISLFQMSTIDVTDCWTTINIVWFPSFSLFLFFDIKSRREPPQCVRKSVEESSHKIAPWVVLLLKNPAPVNSRNSSNIVQFQHMRVLLRLKSRWPDGRKLRMSSGMAVIVRRRNARLCDGWIYLSCLCYLWTVIDATGRLTSCFDDRSWATIGYFVRLLDWANVSK